MFYKYYNLILKFVCHNSSSSLIFFIFAHLAVADLSHFIHQSLVLQGLVCPYIIGHEKCLLPVRFAASHCGSFDFSGAGITAILNSSLTALIILHTCPSLPYVKRIYSMFRLSLVVCNS